MVSDDEERRPTVARNRNQAVSRVATLDRQFGSRRSKVTEAVFSLVLVPVFREHVHVEQGQVEAPRQVARHSRRADRLARVVDAADHGTRHVFASLFVSQSIAASGAEWYRERAPLPLRRHSISTRRAYGWISPRRIA
jgi:hypothetical protein